MRSGGLIVPYQKWGPRRKWLLPARKMATKRKSRDTTPKMAVLSVAYLSSQRWRHHTHAPWVGMKTVARKDPAPSLWLPERDPNPDADPALSAWFSAAFPGVGTRCWCQRRWGRAAAGSGDDASVAATPRRPCEDPDARCSHPPHLPWPPPLPRALRRPGKCRETQHHRGVSVTGAA